MEALLLDWIAWLQVRSRTSGCVSARVVCRALVLTSRAVLCGEQNIRNVIAFPKAGSGRELMTESPTTVNSDELSAQLGLVYAPE